MLVDVEIALGGDLQVDQRMARKLLQHVIEKADTGRNLVHPGAVEVQLDQDLRFGRIASDGGGAHDGRALSSLKRHRRSEERRVRKECVSRCRLWWWRYH